MKTSSATILIPFVIAMIGILFFINHYANAKLEELHLLAEQGDANAQVQLCDYYLNKNNNDVAIGWLKKAANSGKLDAQYRLGTYYFLGENVAQDFHEAFNYLKKSAEQNHPDAQSLLGICYLNGFGVKKDFHEAIKWMKTEYENDGGKGDIEGYLSRAVHHLDRISNWKNPWSNFVYVSYSEREDGSFLYRIGLSHYLGKGVEKDEESGVKLIEQAAQAGNKQARYNYGWILFLKGNNADALTYLSGCKKGTYELGDKEAAIRTALSRAGKGDNLAQFIVGMNYYRTQNKAPRKGSATDTKETELPDRQYYWAKNEEGASWLKRALYGGDSTLQYEIGSFLVEQESDWDLCREALTLSARQGNPQAQCELWRQIVKNGYRPDRELLDAFHYLEAAGHNGILEAQLELAKVFSYDYFELGLLRDKDGKVVYIGTKKSVALEELRLYSQNNWKNVEKERLSGWLESQLYDKRDAFFWYKKAADQGHVESQYNVGILALNGRASNATALNYLSKAAEHGIIHAQALVGKLYLSGDGVEHNIEKAEYWLRKAAAQGSVEARETLSILSPN